MANITAAMVKELREITAAAMMECKKALVECDGDMEAAKELLRKKGQAIASKKSSRETKEGAISTYVGADAASLVKVACETDFVAINDQFKTFIAKVAEQVIAKGVDTYKENTTVEGTEEKETFTEAIAGLGENMAFLGGVDWKKAENGAFGAYVHSNGKIGVLVELVADKAADEAAMGVLAKDIAMHIAASPVEAVSEKDLDPAIIEKEKAFQIEQAQESGKPMNIIEKMIEGRMKKFKKEICLLDQGFVKSPDKSIAQLVEEKGKELGCTIEVTKYYKEQF